MTYAEMSRMLRSTKTRERFNRLYSQKEFGYAYQMRRYSGLLTLHEDVFGREDALCFVSAPGRSELIGNHTDHNGGRVLAAAINVDTIACAARRQDNVVRFISEGYEPFEIALTELTPQPEEMGTSAALIRGVAAKMRELGYQVGGFDATATSDVLRGSGMSSSAAFEVLICAIFDQLYNDFSIDATTRASIAQYAENDFFMKPSGLMDQMASSTGGLVAINFQSAEPEVLPISFSFADAGYELVIVNTGGSHDDLTNEYAAIPEEMKAVAACFDAEALRFVRQEQFIKELPQVRQIAGDRAALRAFHFFGENERVNSAVQALQEKDMPVFLEAIRASGLSSWTLLQNVYSGAEHQQMAVSLAFADTFLGIRGASRIHGGGFAGTTLHFVPEDIVDGFVEAMNDLFGAGACHTVDVRPEGAVIVAR